MPDLKLTFEMHLWVDEATGKPIYIQDDGGNEGCPVVVPVLTHAVAPGGNVDLDRLPKAFCKSGQWYEWDAAGNHAPPRLHTSGQWTEKPANTILECGDCIQPENPGTCEISEEAKGVQPLACGWRKIGGRWRWVCW